MKILHATPYFNPKFGGEVTVCSNLSKELAKRNHEVTIITTNFHFDPHYADAIRAEGVTVIPLPTVAHFGLVVLSPSLKIWLVENLKNFDIIHLHNFRSYQNVVIHKYAMKLKIPYILQAHGSVLPSFQSQNLKKVFDYIWGDQILRDAEKLIAVSKFEKDQYLRMGLPEKKIDIIPNGIDMCEYSSLPQYGKFREKYGIESEEKIILYLGRIHKIKGLDFLIDGFSSLLDEYKKIKLVIAGPDAGYLDVLTQQIINLNIENQILITGPLYKIEKIEAFVDADVLIYPGRIEIFGLVPFEALMCGTPVIVTNDCGCGEVINEANCGYLIQYGNIEDLRQRILQVFNDNVQSNQFVKNGQNFIKDNLNLGHHANKFEQIYFDKIGRND